MEVGGWADGGPAGVASPAVAQVGASSPALPGLAPPRRRSPRPRGVGNGAGERERVKGEERDKGKKQEGRLPASRHRRLLRPAGGAGEREGERDRRREKKRDF